MRLPSMRIARGQPGCLLSHTTVHRTAALAPSPVLAWAGSVAGTVRSAKRTLIHICSQCGALLLEEAEKCSFCDAVLVEEGELRQPVAVSVSTARESGEPEWRREVSRRLEIYRARRGLLRPDDSQSGLPFLDEPTLEDLEEIRERSRLRPVQRQRHAERVEICIQPELDFSSAPDDRAHPQTALVPVAGLAERRGAGALDALFLFLTYAGFLALFRSLGGKLMIEKVDAAVYLAVFFLFYAQYFFLFTTLAGATLGMQIRGLTIVRLDGSLPDTRQLLWRSFGYILSGATLMLGFIWSLWDEDHFTWQDRISQTYITAAAPLAETPSLNVSAGRHRFAHK
jgi:uncharacterized RDD family membrane protein YckC